VRKTPRPGVGAARPKLERSKPQELDLSIEIAGPKQAADRAPVAKADDLPRGRFDAILANPFTPGAQVWPS
jgi:hypothetical protein